MDPEIKQNPTAKPIEQGAPGALPVIENKTFLTHTMEEDVLKAKGQGYVPLPPEAVKPFTQPITPPVPSPSYPSGNQSAASRPQSDLFREALDEKRLERDQPFPFDANTPSGADTEKKFQIYVPQKKRGGSIMTLILIAVLVLLLGGGGFAYYWFFVKKAATTQAPTPTPPVTPEPVVAEPVTPEPQPAPEQTPTPVEQPVVIIEAATTTAPVVIVEPATTTAPIVTPPLPVVEIPLPTPVVPEPAASAPLISVDRTVIVAVTTLNDADVYAKIALENAKITDDKLIIRYLFKLSTENEKRFLTQKETAALLSLTIPTAYWKQSTALEFIGYKNMGSFRYGFVSSIANKAAMQKVASAWEKTVIDNLKSLYVEKAPVKPAIVRFSSNTYLDFTKRYINLPAPDVSLDWAVSANYFVIATSKDMIFAALDKTQTVQAQQSAPPATTTAPTVPSY